MTNQEIARQRYTAFQAEMTAFTFGPWATMTIEERDAARAEIDARHGYRHGWIIVDGQGFSPEVLFPEQHWPRFPADQGCSD